ncbi:MAG: FtsQ-type POTRA domain-containing protein [Peptostreptococcaceae bacterium]|nr:FtsQ-type POTRA domain-containing protein [Peptostreptococcaceae bacterium]
MPTIAKKIFSKKNIALTVLVFGIVVLSYLFLPLFHAKHIIILGNTNIQEDDISNYTKADMKRNVFLIKKRQIKEDFLSDPYIKNISIEPRFPRTLVFRITARKPVATVKFTGGFAIIDDDATVLETTQDMNRIVKPMISGIEPKDIVIGQPMQIKTGDLALGIDIVSNIKSAKLLSNISLIDISDVRDIKMITPHGINVLIGEGKDLNEKMLVLNKILINLFERKIYSGYVDMRFDSYPVYRSKK